MCNRIIFSFILIFDFIFDLSLRGIIKELGIVKWKNPQSTPSFYHPVWHTPYKNKLEKRFI
jgi:hypothetical protein